MTNKTILSQIDRLISDSCPGEFDDAAEKGYLRGLQAARAAVAQHAPADVEEAFLALCEAAGVPATAFAAQEYRARQADQEAAWRARAEKAEAALAAALAIPDQDGFAHRLLERQWQVVIRPVDQYGKPEGEGRVLSRWPSREEAVADRPNHGRETSVRWVPNEAQPGHENLDILCRDVEVPLSRLTAGLEADLEAQAEITRQWRNLALQFDGHRMEALGMLRAIAEGHDMSAYVAEFVARAPLSGEEVLAQRLAALARESPVEPDTESPDP